MKKTVWEIDGGRTELIYYSEGNEIYFRQSSTKPTPYKSFDEIALDRCDVQNMLIALGELLVELDSEKVREAFGDAA